MLGMRVARELELPAKDKTSFIDDKGKRYHRGAIRCRCNRYVLQQRRIKRRFCLSSKGRWAMITGIKQQKNITIGIIDHPLNVGYPTYWHARGYGLFAANPLEEKYSAMEKKN